MQNLLILFLGFFVSYLQAQTYNVQDYGAIPNGKTVNTIAIQKALDDCAQKGGGTVFIPTGTFLTGTIRVYSHINLELSSGAILLGSKNLADYNDVHNQLIWGDSIENFSITGTGIINGQGETFFNKGEKQDQNSWRANERPEPWIRFTNANRIQVKGVQFTNSPAHVLVFQGAKEVFIDNISIRNDMRSPNTDGIDLKDCQDVLISNCFISTGDDAICLKAGQGNVENIVVSNCILASDDSALKFGTGSKYKIRNCQFSNINIRDTRYGIALFMNQGGVFENCLFQNIIIETLSRHVMEYPIFMDIDKRTPTYELGTIRNITFKDMQITTSGQILVGGQQSARIQDLNFDNVTIYLTDLADPSKVSKKPRGNRKFKKVAGMEDFSGKTAHLAFANVDGLRLNNLKIRQQFEKSAVKRQTFFFHQVEGIELFNVKTAANLKHADNLQLDGYY